MKPCPQLEALTKRGLIREAEGESALSDWQEFRLFGNFPVGVLTIELTARCNYNCRHCFNAANAGYSKEELSLGEVRRILEGAAECGISHVMLTGGEPMMHRDFEEILEIIRENDLVLHAVNTNGAFITDHILEEIARSGSRPLMKISFDGFGFHDWMRGKKGAEKCTLDAIRTCVENHFPVYVQTNMNRRNLDSILPTLEALDEMGVSHTRVIRTTEAPRWLENGRNACLTWNEYFDSALEIMRAYSGKEHQMSLEFWQFGSLEMKRRQFAGKKILPTRQYENALRCSEGLAVCAGGEAVPCMQMSGWLKAEHICLGSIKHDSMENLLCDSPVERLITARVKDLIRECRECRECPFLPYCHGGCPAMGMLVHGTFLSRDISSCIFFRDGYHRRLKEALPGFRDLSPMPDDIDPAYLQGLSCPDFPRAPDKVTVTELF